MGALRVLWRSNMSLFGDLNVYALQMISPNQTKNLKNQTRTCTFHPLCHRILQKSAAAASSSARCVQTMSVISVFCPKIMKLFAQSICTHYFSLSGPPDIFLGSGTLRKRSKIWVAKSRVQKTRISVIQKEKKQPGLFSF